MASGAGNRRGQDDARMCVLTRGTGERSGAKDPGTKPPGGLRYINRNNSITPSRERTTDDGAREERASPAQAGRNYTTAHPTRPAPSCPRGDKNDSITDGKAGPKER